MYANDGISHGVARSVNTTTPNQHICTSSVNFEVHVIITLESFLYDKIITILFPIVLHGTLQNLSSDHGLWINYNSTPVRGRIGETTWMHIPHSCRVFVAALI